VPRARTASSLGRAGGALTAPLFDMTMLGRSGSIDTPAMFRKARQANPIAGGTR
jgi:hypothetical protein